MPALYAEIRQVKFRKDRVKIQIWGKPVIFSHELCLYITRFVGSAQCADFGQYISRSTHVHEVSRRAMPVIMCALRVRVGHGHVEQMSEIIKKDYG